MGAVVAEVKRRGPFLGISDFVKPSARAWCETVVQSVGEPVKTESAGINPLRETGRIDFGRRFRQIRFRWLTPTEI